MSRYHDFEMFACPCCHIATLEKRGQSDICPICAWEDEYADEDRVSDDWEGYTDGPNQVTLEEHRKKWEEAGRPFWDISLLKYGKSF